MFDVEDAQEELTSQECKASSTVATSAVHLLAALLLTHRHPFTAATLATPFRLYNLHGYRSEAHEGARRRQILKF